MGRINSLKVASSKESGRAKGCLGATAGRTSGGLTPGRLSAEPAASQGSPSRSRAAPPLCTPLHLFNERRLLLLITKNIPIAGSVSALFIVHLSNSVNLLFEFDFLCGSFKGRLRLRKPSAARLPVGIHACVLAPVSVGLQLPLLVCGPPRGLLPEPRRFGCWTCLLSV